MGQRTNGFHPHGHWANLFEITNRRDLVIEYRLVDIEGLPLGSHYEKSVNLLSKAIAFALRQPIALVRRGESSQLAVPVALSRSLKSEWQLTPHVARLTPHEETLQLDLARPDDATGSIAARFLEYALRTPLMHDHSLWSVGRWYYEKRPLNFNEQRSAVDLYPGFGWGVVAMDDGRLFVSVDTTTRYVDRDWFLTQLNGGDATDYRGHHFLYHYGHQWYVVQLWGITGLSIIEQRFNPDGRSEPIDVLAYTSERWSPNPPAWVRDLDPNSPAIVYRSPGKDQDRYGALALCKRMRRTSNAEAGSRHSRSILAPVDRIGQQIQTIERYFQAGRLGNQPIRVTPAPLALPRRVFSVPAQVFGHDRVLAAGKPNGASSTGQWTEFVPLEQLGASRLRLLGDKKAGPLDTSPFDAQYLLLPKGLPRAVNEDFERRFETGMREISGQDSYRARRILYEDRGATSLRRQVQAIKQALTDNGIGHGYTLLVLPNRAHPDLHNYIKRDLWPSFQFQCATANKIQSFYAPLSRDGEYRPQAHLMGRLGSYVRNCALGMMIVNRKWLWALATPLHYDVYVGVDVLNQMAGFTFVYEHGRHIIFREFPSRQKERLTTPQLRTIMTEHLRQDLTELGLRPRSIVVHRDGRSFASELEGMRAAIASLKRDGVLPLDALLGVVDVRKTSADRLRLYEGDHPARVQNPTIGSYLVLGPTTGIVCNTGQPARIPGTVNPLSAVVVEGGLDIEWVLEDLFALAQGSFSAPDKPSRLPLTIKLADDFLRPIAGDADDDAALYEEEPDNDSDIDETQVAPEVAASSTTRV